MCTVGISSFTCVHIVKSISGFLIGLMGRSIWYEI